MGDTATLLRLVAASALVGLLAYCGAHAVQVWRRRNARPNDPDRPGPARKVAWVCLLTGLLLTPAAAVLRELTRSEGVLSGEDLYVLRARDDLAVEWLHAGDATAAGEPLARFGSAPSASKADEARARLTRAQAERDVLALSPLSPDPELTRRHQGVSQERAQVQQELGHAVAAAEAADRDLTAQLLAKKEALARLERTLTEKRKDLDRAGIRAAHERELIRPYAALVARGSVTPIEYQEHQKALKESEAEAVALTQELKDGQAEKDLLKTHIARLEAAQSDPEAALKGQLAALRTRLARLETEEADLKAALDRDVARTIKLREAELAQAAARVRECEAAVAALAGGQEVRAPFAGKVAYRAPSPNAVRPGGALLVLGPENGFLLTARLPRAEADAVRDGGEVELEVEGDGPERVVPARFHKADELAHEPGHAALQLECQPPPEVVRRLADGEKLTVAFAWHPPLASLWPFRAGLGLIGLGAVGLAFTRRRPNQSRALARWKSPVPAGPTADAIGLTLSELLGPRRIGLEARAAIENGGADAVADDPLPELADGPIPADELEEWCRAAIARLNRTDSPEEAARLLDRLHRVRTTLRDLRAAPPAPESDGEPAAGVAS
jgi:predicted  nucleic acid-binding Zn-ribbon protein